MFNIKKKNLHDPIELSTSWSPDLHRHKISFQTLIIIYHKRIIYAYEVNSFSKFHFLFHTRTGVPIFLFLTLFVVDTIR